MSTDHFTLFQEALGSTDRPTKVILFADLAGSTEMKDRSGEVGWLPTIGKFLDITTEATTEHGGTVVKYLGDGTLVAFDGENAAEAICSAIRIQEKLRFANSQGVLNDCLATVGIATGRVVEYKAPGGGLDYVGSVVDLAARLCSAAAPQAIWVDSATVASANMSKVSSRMGIAHDYSPDDYLSEEWRVELKGFSKPIKYREVIWRGKPFGATNALVDEISERTKTQTNHQTSTRPNDFCEGVVRKWDPEQGRGFISTVSDGDYYLDRRHVASGEDLVEGRSVRFVLRPPFKDGGRPVAGCAIQEGHHVRATFQRIFAHKGYGFVDVRDSLGNQQSLFLYLGDDTVKHRPGDTVTVEASRNHKGISARIADEPQTTGGADDDQ
ncbi:adenylate/guanylate cyclase domain-containing protein [Saccharomonospora cyanea]|uniref:Family 3 adenylate cyclase n=1 Tax=Saccharomonospora cyanea NA-134 TaxID=882082 RepID=H5XF95_9PSEU|nr:adenylate/guanylate cyclase domain-containing protein [Saccharomonospora cyanea]EHR61505.1 family 3 adenylate cyclase [Saccharomonospora cyanea NA-134]